MRHSHSAFQLEPEIETMRAHRRLAFALTALLPVGLSTTSATADHVSPGESLPGVPAVSAFGVVLPLRLHESWTAASKEMGGVLGTRIRSPRWYGAQFAGVPAGARSNSAVSSPQVSFRLFLSSPEARLRQALQRFEGTSAPLSLSLVFPESTRLSWGGRSLRWSVVPGVPPTAEPLPWAGVR